MKIDSPEARAAAARRKARQKRDALLYKKVSTLTAAELISMLTERYRPSKIPLCRVCGGKLVMQSCGGGPTVWACSGQDKKGYLPGRTPADEHYSNSRYEDYRCGGDSWVMELIRRFKKAIPK